MSKTGYLHIENGKDEIVWRMSKDVADILLARHEHLEKLLEKGCEVQLIDGCCFFCEADLLKKEQHSTDCPYVAAKAFLERGCVP